MSVALTLARIESAVGASEKLWSSLRFAASAVRRAERETGINGALYLAVADAALNDCREMAEKAMAAVLAAQPEPRS